MRLYLLVMIGLTSACSVLPEAKSTVMNKYVLEYSADNAGPALPVDLPVMIITVPRAHSGYNTTKIAYRKQLFGLRYYTKSRWADTPGRMLAPLVAEAMNYTGAFQAQYASPGALSASYRLDSELIDFYQDFTVQPSRMRITLRAQLVSLQDNRVLATQLFDVRETADSEDAYGGVQAANRATAALLQQLADFCESRTAR
jgi:cholesterol transport system auxiliary component